MTAKTNALSAESLVAAALLPRPRRPVVMCWHGHLLLLLLLGTLARPRMLPGSWATSFVGRRGTVHLRWEG